MKIRHREIERWRNLADLTIELDAGADFICLVSVNGVGTSNLLELMGRCHSSAASPSASPEASFKGWNRPLSDLTLPQALSRG